MKITSVSCAVCAALILSGCAGPGDGQGHGPRGGMGHGMSMGFPPPMGGAETRSEILDLLRHDTDKNGSLTRAELDAGLHSEFARADADGDGRLNLAETRAENDRRWRQAGTRTTPLLDWNSDGFLSEDEFSNAGRSLFMRFDKDGDGVVTKEEIDSPPMPPGKGLKPGGRQRRPAPPGNSPGG